MVKAPLLALLGSTAISGVVSLTTLLGLLDAGFLVAYTAGSFVVPAALDLDRRDPWEVVWVALAIAAVSQVLLCGTWVYLLAPGLGLGQIGVALGCCAVNGAAQSVLYPACKQLMAGSFGANGAVLGFWNTCYYLGGVASTMLAAAACQTFSWPAAFLVPGFLLLLLACCGAATGRIGMPARSTPQQRTVVTEPKHATDDGTEKRFLELLWPSSPAIRVVAMQYFAVKLIRYAFGLWLPLLLAVSRLDVGDPGAGLLQVAGTASLFDVGAIVGSLAMGAQAERAGLSALPWLVLAASVALSMLLPAVPAVMGDTSGAVALVTLILGMGMATGGSETLLGSISPIHYATQSRTSVSSAVASVNGYGSLGTVAAAVALPLLAGAGGAPDLALAFAKLAPLAWLAAGAAGLQAASTLRGETAEA